MPFVARRHKRTFARQRESGPRRPAPTSANSPSGSAACYAAFNGHIVQPTVAGRFGESHNSFCVYLVVQSTPIKEGGTCSRDDSPNVDRMVAAPIKKILRGDMRSDCQRRSIVMHVGLSL